MLASNDLIKSLDLKNLVWALGLVATTCLVACAPPAGKRETNAVEAAGNTPAPIPVAEVKGTAVDTEVPLEVEGGTFVVPVSINDTIALKFTIDSGAADVSIPADVASTLVRSGTITKDDYIGAQTFVLADGTAVPSHEFRIRSLKVGTLVLHNVTGSLSGPSGELLLGQSFLTRLTSWSIDNKRKVLILKAAGPDVEAGRPVALPAVASDDTGPESVEAAAMEAEGWTPAALAIAKAYFSAWSDPRDVEGEGVRKYYSDRVRFYETSMSRDQVMAEKAKFARRWPERHYIPRADSLRGSCSDPNTCVVTGVIDWSTADPASGRRSSGIASVTLKLRDGLIESEGGAVTSRGP